MILQSRKTLILTAFSFSLRSAAETEVETRSAGRVAARLVTTERKRVQTMHDYTSITTVFPPI